MDLDLYFNIKNTILTTKNYIQRNFSTNKKIEIVGEKLITVNDTKTLLQILKSSKTIHPEIEVQSEKVYNSMLEYQW